MAGVGFTSQVPPQMFPPPMPYGATPPVMVPPLYGASQTPSALVPPEPAIPSPLPIATGALVRIGGLQSRPDLNGRMAKVLSFDRTAGRWECELLGAGAKHGFLRCKPENLHVMSVAGAPTGRSEEAPDNERGGDSVVARRSRSRKKSRSRSRRRKKSSSSSSSSSSSRSSSSSSRSRRKKKKRERSANFYNISQKPKKSDRKTKKRDKKVMKDRSAGADAASFLLGLK